MIFWGQIRISDEIQKSSIAKTAEHNLYFVDFWATWCGPCIHVAKYLTTLQEAFPNDLHIMSLTQENSDLVKRFMKKHTSSLAVAIDYQGETFKKYKIQSLPYGILFNAEGNILWQGHPADFKESDVRYFLKRHRKKVALNVMYPLETIKQTVQTEKELIDDFEITPLATTDTSFQILKKEQYTELRGTLQEILAYTQNVYKGQIQISAPLNDSYKIRVKPETDAFENLTNSITQALKLEIQNNLQKGEVLLFSVNTANFWDTDQINWGNNTPNFLIGDNDLQADNVSLQKVAYQLATLLEMPIYVPNTETTNSLHDWNIHYRFYELMISSLSDTYGIDVEKKITSYPIYNITKKAP
jgi:thiol-disulfide isomerase/thioredoxin